MQALRLQGVGIDLLSLKRVRAFLKTSGLRRARRLLTQKELSVNQNARNREADFAKRFAAKEAYFKARGGAWMGLEGFGALEVKLLTRGRFRVTPAEDYFPDAEPAEGSFFLTDDLVGAQVQLWRTL